MSTWPLDAVCTVPRPRALSGDHKHVLTIISLKPEEKVNNEYIIVSCYFIVLDYICVDTNANVKHNWMSKIKDWLKDKVRSIKDRFDR